MRDVGVALRHTSTAWPVRGAGRSPGARGGNAIAQLPRLSEESFELLHGSGRGRNVALGARRENPCHHSTPLLEVVRVRTPGQAAYAFPAHEVYSRRRLFGVTTDETWRRRLNAESDFARLRRASSGQAGFPQLNNITRFRAPA